MHDQDMADQIRKAKHGDAEALEEVLQELEPYLLDLAPRLVGRGWMRASDLVQIARMRIWERISTFEGSDDNELCTRRFKAWIKTTMRRAAIDDWRTQERRVPTVSIDKLNTNSTAGGLPQVTDGSPTPSRNFRFDEEARIVCHAISQIRNEDDRRIIELHFFEGASLRQIAKSMGIEDKKLRVRFHDLLDRLGLDLEELK